MTIRGLPEGLEKGDLTKLLKEGLQTFLEQESKHI